jgi:hypothetical protein
MRQQVQTTGDGWKVAPIPAEVFNVNSHDCTWVNAQCTPQPLACLEVPIRLRGGLARIQDVTHILATGWGGSGGSPIPASHERAKMKGWRTRTIACGHEVMLDLPNELTGLLLEYAYLEIATRRRREQGCETRVDYDESQGFCSCIRSDGCCSSLYRQSS